LVYIATTIDQLASLVQNLQGILVQYATRHQEVVSLEEQQQQLKHLHTIFSKELLIVVLQDFLPTMQSTINTYLSEVTEYTLSFELEQTASDTVNLEIYVEDNKGKRVVKSLSGGQKSLLKLARIFSIATMLQLPFLFLDETITSLDTITTSHVADVLHRFAQQFSTKLYIITHAPQIQEMHIWDKEIQLAL
jgi:DNA repair exonuclease SbcCD ATPase subunit